MLRAVHPRRRAAAQKGSSDQRISPARSKKRAMVSGETRIGRQGKKRRSVENGKQEHHAGTAVGEHVEERVGDGRAGPDGGQGEYGAAAW